jgi:Homeodomain-like domain
MRKKYVVRLTREEREQLKALVSKGRASARKIGRAQVLLKVDADGPNWTDQQAADAFGRRRKLDGAGEARLIAMACGDPPEGRARWTLRLLAGQMVELAIVDGISHETVRQTLKKTS